MEITWSEEIPLINAKPLGPGISAYKPNVRKFSLGRRDFQHIWHMGMMMISDEKYAGGAWSLPIWHSCIAQARSAGHTDILATGTLCSGMLCDLKPRTSLSF